MQPRIIDALRARLHNIIRLLYTSCEIEHFVRTRHVSVFVFVFMFVFVFVFVVVFGFVFVFDFVFVFVFVYAFVFVFVFVDIFWAGFSRQYFRLWWMILLHSLVFLHTPSIREICVRSSFFCSCLRSPFVGESASAHLRFFCSTGTVLLCVCVVVLCRVLSRWDAFGWKSMFFLRDCFRSYVCPPALCCTFWVA